MQNEQFIYPAINMKATGENIKRLMRKKGFSVSDIRDQLGLTSSQSVYHWMSGISMPSIDNIYALSELFRVPIDLIIRGDRRYGALIRSENAFLLYNRFLMYYERVTEDSV